MIKEISITVGCALLLVVALGACKSDDEDDAPTCDDLQVEANGCKTTTQSEKDAFAQVAATCKSQTRFTADCRKCLSGKICGVTESCDSLCGK